MIRNKRNLLLAAGLLMSTASWGQQAASASFMENNFQSIVMYLLIVVLVIFIVSILTIFKGFLNVMVDNLPEARRGKYESSFWSGLSWKSINSKLTDAVPVEKERDILLDHEYDGIRELDNHLPPWWKWLFYITIVYAVVYFSHHYILGTAKNQYEIYDEQVAEAEIAKAEFLSQQANNVDETTVVLSTNPDELLAGKEIFLANCVACHGQLGEGNMIGPNLVDEYWIHGGDIKDVFTTVKYGIANKMIAWGEQLLPSQVSDVSNFVLSLQGSNPPDAKEAQGDFYDPAAAVEDEGDETGDETEGVDTEGVDTESPEDTGDGEITATTEE